MQKKREQGNAPEVLMKLMAEARGEDTFCFIFDYETPKGEDLHAPFWGTGRDLVEVARAIKTLLEEQGNTVSTIAYFPGFHTREDLTAYGESGPKVPFQYLYIGQPIMTAGGWIK